MWLQKKVWQKFFSPLSLVAVFETCTWDHLGVSLEKLVVLFNCEEDTKFSVADPGSGIRCLFDTWIRDPEWFFSGSRIPNPYVVWELSDHFLGKKFNNSLKIGPNFFLLHFKNKIIYNFLKFVVTICGFTPLFSCCF